MTNPTGNETIDSVMWGGWQWVNTSGNPVNLKYFFDDSESFWVSPEENAYKLALQAFSDVSNISFEEVFSKSSANLVEYVVTDQRMSEITNPDLDQIVFGFHEPPEYADVNAQGVWQAEGYFNYESWSWPAKGLVYDSSGLAPGGWGFRLLMHELGHALGLGHPHDTSGGVGAIMPGVSSNQDYGDFNLNQGVFSVMSYNRGWEIGQNPQGNNISDFGYNKGLAALDIAAIQYKYGADTHHKHGNTTYTMTDNGSWMAIWDTGGTDTIRYNGNGNVHINLNSATLDNSSSGGGYLSYVENTASTKYYGGFTIAGDYTGAINNRNGEIGVIIENATGGSGSDILTGNRVANTLTGQNGDDVLSGRQGNDILYGDLGADKLSGDLGQDKLYGGVGKDKLFGGGSDDRLFGGNGNDRLYGGTRNDDLFGGTGNDRMYGGDGNDVMFGGGGRDKMFGGDGNDTMNGGAGSDDFSFVRGLGSDRVKKFEDDIDTLRFDDAIWGGGLTVRQMLNTYATDTGANVKFNFGGGNAVVVEDVARVLDLLDDIEFF